MLSRKPLTALAAAVFAATITASTFAHASTETAASAKQDATEIKGKMAAYKKSNGKYPAKLDAATLKAMGVTMNGSNKVTLYSTSSKKYFRYCVVASDGGWSTLAVYEGGSGYKSGASGKKCVFAGPPTGPQ